MKPTITYLAGLAGGVAIIQFGWKGVLLGAVALLIALAVSLATIAAERHHHFQP